MNQRAREVSNAKGEGNDGKCSHALPCEQRKLAKENYRYTDYRKDKVVERFLFKHSHELKHSANIETVVADVSGDLDIYFNVSLLCYFVVTELLPPLFTCVGELRHFSNLCMVLY